MNIFFLDIDPTECAAMHANKHVVKMILETCQLLCTVWHVSCVNEPPPPSLVPYKKTHVNHPCSKWARASRVNYVWLCALGRALCAEYTFRYNKVHKCEPIIKRLSRAMPSIPDAGWTPPAQAMPDAYKKKESVVDAYRAYYVHEKSHLHTWTGRDVPHWISQSSL